MKYFNFCTKNHKFFFKFFIIEFLDKNWFFAPVCIRQEKYLKSTFTVFKNIKKCLILHFVVHFKNYYFIFQARKFKQKCKDKLEKKIMRHFWAFSTTVTLSRRLLRKSPSDYRVSLSGFAHHLSPFNFVYRQKRMNECSQYIEKCIRIEQFRCPE